MALRLRGDDGLGADADGRAGARHLDGSRIGTLGANSFATTRRILERTVALAWSPVDAFEACNWTRRGFVEDHEDVFADARSTDSNGCYCRSSKSPSATSRCTSTAHSRALIKAARGGRVRQSE